ncbi:transketolase C-terminal domain-containing protein [Streptomyces sp. ME02-8801-2C]|uniref:transketolase family protein n=1 Tax=Streptomyces sp. ME02-8801-2C TaxID=3028680 RepID=UPI0029A72A9B|nr:transketolase C-terminal domain-containing protein [Streptomyces sp. ME02-8801-2C]MDX3458196.1 transketolase C-terminal domain-containing protein [Streptomyces sp. ME02-8801-2C]
MYVLDGDCARSTRSARFQQRFPESFLNAGIAEQNMIGMAAGLALTGFRPVVSGFSSIVVGRGAEQILLSLALPGLPVTIAGHYAGLSAGLEGAPHHGITDLAFLRAVPGMSIWVPADNSDVAHAGGAALAAEGPAYVRLSRDPVPPVAGGPLVEDSLRLWAVPRPRVTLVGCGVAVGVCVRAADELNAQGVPTAVVGVLRLKPFAQERFLDLVGQSELVVTVEEHTTIGGLGGCVAEVIAAERGPRTLTLGIADRFTETGPHAQLLERYGISCEAITTTVRDALGPGDPRETEGGWLSVPLSGGARRK